MVGINSELDKENQFNYSRPILIEPFNKNQLKINEILHIQYESNPIDSKSDYRIYAKSQPLQINYHAVILFPRFLYKIPSIYFL